MFFYADLCLKGRESFASIHIQLTKVIKTVPQLEWRESLPKEQHKQILTRIHVTIARGNSHVLSSCFINVSLGSGLLEKEVKAAV